MATILFEQPVTEPIRVCLRLEQLFNHAQQTLTHKSSWASRASLTTLIELINVLDRPDLKAKLVKELSRHLISLSRLEQTPQIDQKKLSSILIELENLIDGLHSVTGKLGQVLRDNEFINSLRQHFAIPGGGCSFDLPILYYWLQQPAEERIAQLIAWYQQFTVVQSAVTLLLRLLRQSNVAQTKLAQQGFYQISLETQKNPCQLIQVTLPDHLYPEISAGRHHGLFIRFFEPNIHERSQQTPYDVEFLLNVCSL